MSIKGDRRWAGPGWGRSGRAASSGFTLIEVLTALVILSLVLGIVFRIFSGGFAAVERADRQARALTVAESILAQALAAERTTAGEWVSDEDGFRRTVTATPRPAADGLILFEIAVRVDGPGGGGLVLRSAKLERAP